MSILTAIIAELAGDAGVSAIVGARIIANQANQDEALPHIVINRIGGEQFQNATAASGLAAPTFQITCWETEPGKNETLATAVREALDGFKGTMGSGGNTANVRTCWLGPSVDLNDEDTGRKFSAHGVAMPFSIMHKETVPTF